MTRIGVIITYPRSALLNHSSEHLRTATTLPLLLSISPVQETIPVGVADMSSYMPFYLKTNTIKINSIYEKIYHYFPSDFR